MINKKSEQLDKTFYNMFLNDILGQSSQDIDKLNDDIYGNYRHLDHKIIEIN